MKTEINLIDFDASAATEEPSVSPAYRRNYIRRTVRRCLLLGKSLEETIYYAQKNEGVFKPDIAALAAYFYGVEVV